MEFFFDGSVSLGIKMLEIFYVVMGFTALYAGIHNLRDTTNPSRIGTGVFWSALGIVVAFGRWIPPFVSGLLVLTMILPAVCKRISRGTRSEAPKREEIERNFEHIGMKIFIPALCLGLFSASGALIAHVGALTGCCLGVVVAMIVLRCMNRSNMPRVFFSDAERLLSVMGAVSMLPMLLAVFGEVLTVAGVGQTISSLVGTLVPKGNVVLGVIIFALGMMLFTIIMGNAFAAIAVMTVGVGAPMVLAYGANPTAIGVLALTCGFCGTLITPMAANFNIVPVALLEMRDRMGVIKCQIVTACVMIVVQIIYMMLFI